ncbi:hypothetical protein [Halothermothrix orenii]|uniref:Uncharacterized protein n=1 Tax=Halothermothrix orenii (strain H 168 / OCM 544 / DSM 9562) TaxID=373903 RepID=B8CY77_HALOH|nr:hypothetical protein [Halothermothrix orenii]ACL70246.1 hypothetical protein Hore_14970 [Halothermothrix orenii H 168]
MKRIKLMTVFLILILLMGLFQITAGAVSREEWVEDLNYLTKKLPQVHKNLYFNITEKEFKDMIDDIKADLPELTDAEVALRLQEVFNQIGDQHTGFDSRKFLNSYYPIFFAKVGHEYRVVMTTTEYKDLLGAKLLCINDKSIPDVIESLNRVIVNENRTALLYKTKDLLNRPQYLKYCGIIKGQNKYIFQTREGIKYVTFREISFYELKVRKLVKLKYKKSIAYRNINRLFWYKYLPDSNILYFQYNKC